jgi:hypothetical protein
LQDFKEAARLSAEAKALAVAATAATEEAHGLAGRLAAVAAQQAGQQVELEELQAMKQVGLKFNKQRACKHLCRVWLLLLCWCAVLVMERVVSDAGGGKGCSSDVQGAVLLQLQRSRRGSRWSWKSCKP